MEVNRGKHQIRCQKEWPGSYDVHVMGEWVMDAYLAPSPRLLCTYSTCARTAGDGDGDGDTHVVLTLGVQVHTVILQGSTVRSSKREGMRAALGRG